MSSVLTSENTSKVMQAFKFSVEQVEDLKCLQFFIHSDLVNWMEEKLNSWSDWSAIKIIYDRIHHFDLDHVKCVELYYDGGIRSRHVGEIEKQFFITHYKMPWISESTYYIRNEHQLVNNVKLSLETQNLLTYLTNNYAMSVNAFYGEHNIQVFTFSSELNNSQISKLLKIFGHNDKTVTVKFMTKSFLFLTSWKPPQIMKSEILTALNGGFLESLTIEEILCLELANKDHRLSWCDNALDRDIQNHLRKRFPQFYQNRKCDVYNTNEFSRQEICCYFIHKYYDQCSQFIVQKAIFDMYSYQLLTERSNIVENSSDHHALCVEILSPNNMPICVVTFIKSNIDLTDVSDKSINLMNKQVSLNYFPSADVHRSRLFSMNRYFGNSRIDVLKKMNETPNDLIRVLRGITDSERALNRLILCWKDFEYGHLRNSFLKKTLPSWLKEENFKRPLTLEFNRITFHVQTLYKYVRKFLDRGSHCELNLTFIECRFILYLRKINTLVRKYKTSSSKRNYIILRCSLNLVKMNVEIQTVFYIASCVPHYRSIFFDTCFINPPGPLKKMSGINNIKFKNTRLSIETLVTIFNAAINCHILHIDNCYVYFEDNTASTYDGLSNVDCYISHMKLGFETLLTFVDIFAAVTIENCGIRYRDELDTLSNIISFSNHTRFRNMSISIQQILAILSKREHCKDIEFKSCNILGEMAIQHLSTSLDIVTFDLMSFSEELMNLLGCFNPDCHIRLVECEISHHEVLDMCRRTCNYGKYISIFGTDLLNQIIYFELIAHFYQNNLNEINFELEQDLDIPFHILPNINHIDPKIVLKSVQIKSIPVNGGTIKIEFLFEGKPIDLFFESNNLPDDSEVCEVNYY